MTPPPMAPLRLSEIRIELAADDCHAGPVINTFTVAHAANDPLDPIGYEAADRPLFLGSRPTPFAGADGSPELLEPLT